MPKPWHRAHLPKTVKIAGRLTSVSLEGAFWSALKEIAATQNIAVQDLVSEINKGRTHGNLSSAVRMYVLGYYYDRRDTKT